MGVATGVAKSCWGFVCFCRGFLIQNQRLKEQKSGAPLPGFSTRETFLYHTLSKKCRFLLLTRIWMSLTQNICFFYFALWLLSRQILVPFIPF